MWGKMAKTADADFVLNIPALTSRTAGYVIRMSGAVGGVLSDGRPYPDRRYIFNQVLVSNISFLIEQLCFCIYLTQAIPNHIYCE